MLTGLISSGLLMILHLKQQWEPKQVEDFGEVKPALQRALSWTGRGEKSLHHVGLWWVWTQECELVENLDVHTRREKKFKETSLWFIKVPQAPPPLSLVCFSKTKIQTTWSLGITGGKDFNFLLLSVVDGLFFFNVCPPPMTEPHVSSASCKLHLKVSSKVPMSQASPEPTLPSCVYIHMALTEGEAEWPTAPSFLIDRSVSSTEMWVPWGQGLDPIYLISWVWQCLEQATQHTLFYQASVIWLPGLAVTTSSVSAKLASSPPECLHFLFFSNPGPVLELS